MSVASFNRVCNSNNLYRIDYRTKINTDTFTNYPVTVDSVRQIPLPDELIIKLFDQLHFKDAYKLSLVNKQYRQIKISQAKTVRSMVYDRLFQTGLETLQKEKDLNSILDSLRNLIKIDPKKGMFFLQEILNGDSVLLDRHLHLISTILAENVEVLGQDIKALLKSLQLRCSVNQCGPEALALAYVLIGDLKEAQEIEKLQKKDEIEIKEVVSNKYCLIYTKEEFSSTTPHECTKAIQEICLKSFITNPMQADSIIDIVGEQTVNFSRDFYKKLSFSLNAQQMRIILQLIQKKIGICENLVHGYIFSNNFDLALQCIENSNFSAKVSNLNRFPWETNVYFHFNRMCWFRNKREYLLKLNQLLKDKNIQLKPSHDMNEGNAYSFLKRRSEIDSLKSELEIYIKLGNRKEAITHVEKLRILYLECGPEDSILYLIHLAKQCSSVDPSRAIKLLEDAKILIEKNKSDIFKISKFYLKLSKAWMTIDPNKALKIYLENEIPSAPEIFSLLEKTYKIFLSIPL